VVNACTLHTTTLQIPELHYVIIKNYTYYLYM